MINSEFHVLGNACPMKKNGHLVNGVISGFMEHFSFNSVSVVLLLCLFKPF